MKAIPLQESHAKSATERAERAAWLRNVLGPVSGWPEDWLAEWNERAAIMEFEGGLAREVAEQEAEEALRAERLRRGP